MEIPQPTIQTAMFVFERVSVSIITNYIRESWKGKAIQDNLLFFFFSFFFFFFFYNRVQISLRTLRLIPS